MFSQFKLSVILFALTLMLRYVRWRHPHFAARLKERNLVAQIKARDEGTGRWIEIRDGKISSGAGQHAKPDITLAFKNAALGVSLLTPPINWLNQINAQKDFTLGVDGPEDLTNWFAQTLMKMQTAHWTFGTPMPDGSMRYCNMANAGRFSSPSRTAGLSAPRRSTSTKRPAAVDDSSAWHEFHAAAQDHARPARADQPVDDLFADRLLYPMKRVDSTERQAQSAEPRQVEICPHLVAGSARPGRRRDQTREARSWSGRHDRLARLASYLGPYRLLPQRFVPLRQCRRSHARPS